MIEVDYDRGGGSVSMRCVMLVTLMLASCWQHAGAAVADTAEGNQFFPVADLCRGSRRGQMTRVIVGALIVSAAERDLNCEVTFQTDTILQKFMIRFEKLELDCNDHLWIYDSAYSTGTPLKDLSCRDTLHNVNAIYTHSNHVTLKYITDEWGPASNGFKLVITAFKQKNNACRDFRCETTDSCISKTLACDGVNHCGDNSDESNSFASCPSPPLGELLSLSAGMMGVVGGVVGGMVLLAVVVFGTVICVRRRRALALLQRQRAMSDYQLNQGGDQYGTNGTYGTVLVEKPPPYPGLPQHTNLDSSPGNLRCPALADMVLLEVEVAALLLHLPLLR